MRTTFFSDVVFSFLLSRANHLLIYFLVYGAPFDMWSRIIEKKSRAHEIVEKRKNDLRKKSRAYEKVEKKNRNTK